MYVAGFLEGVATITKTSYIIFGSQDFFKSKSNVEKRSLSTILKLCFYSLILVYCRKCAESHNSCHFLVLSLLGNFSGNQGCNNVKQFVNLLSSMILHVTLKTFFNNCVLREVVQLESHSMEGYFEFVLPYKLFKNLLLILFPSQPIVS